MLYLMQLGNLQHRQPMLASQCINCGACVKQCPQNINIPEELKSVKKEFEGFFTKPLLMLVGFIVSQGQRKERV